MILPDASTALMINASLFIGDYHLDGRWLHLRNLLLLDGYTLIVMHMRGRCQRLREGGNTHTAAPGRLLMVLHVLLQGVTVLVMHRLAQTSMVGRRRGRTPCCSLEVLSVWHTLREIVLVVNAAVKLLGHLGG